tara:strand:- start:2563 stop:2964 length:402 start_codon:yes stop_codon:yes gene_type:complete
MTDSILGTFDKEDYPTMTDVQKYQIIDKLLDETLRPALASDGGGIEIEVVKGNQVVVSYQGACGSCPSSAGATLAGITRALQMYLDPNIEVIPTNAYGMQQPEFHNPWEGQKHPFGGKTYQEQIEDHKKRSGK